MHRRSSTPTLILAGFLAIAAGQGCVSSGDLDFLSDSGSSADPGDSAGGGCEIVASSPSAGTVRMASASSTTFGVVANRSSCVVSFTLNGISLPGDGGAGSPFISLSTSGLFVGANQLRATLSDGQSTQTVTWNIVRNSVPACGTQTPASVGNSVDHTGTLLLESTASDADGDALSFSWEIDGASVSSPNFTVTSAASSSQALFDPTFSQVGSHTVTMKVTDGYDTGSCSWAVSVGDSAVLDILSCNPADSPTVVTSTGADSSKTFTIVATGTSLSYSWKLDGATIGGASSPVLSLNAAGLSVGTHTLVGTVSDVYGNEDACTYNVKRNAPPSLAVVAPSEGVTKKLNVSSLLNFQVTGSDANSDSLSYSWTLDGSTSGYLSSGGATSVLSPAGTAALVGSHTVRVTVSDGFETDQKQWTVEINQFSDWCNGLTSSQVCTLVGLPEVGDGTQVGAAEALNQDRIRILPRSVAIHTVSGVDNLVFTDSMNHGVWYYNRTGGTVSYFGVAIPAYSLKSVIGVGQAGYSGTTPFKLSTPLGIAVNADVPSAPKIYVADYNNHYVHEIDNSGNVTPVLGNGGCGTLDNVGAVAGTTVSCCNPYGLSYRPGSGQLQVACSGSAGNGVIRSLDTATYMTTELVRSGGTTTNGTSGNAGTARTYSPRGISTDPSGNVYWVEPCSAANKGGVVRVYSPSGGTFFGVAVAAGSVGTVVGQTDLPNACSNKTGVASGMRINDAYGLEWASDGLWISSLSGTGGNKVLFVNSTGATVTYGAIPVAAGQGANVLNATTACGASSTSTAGFNGDGNSGATSCINYAMGLALGSQRLYFADYYFYRVRSLDLSVGSGTVSTHLGAGYARWGTLGDTNLPATDSYLYNPSYLAVPASGSSLYVSDYTNGRIRKVDLVSGTVSTYVGKTGGSLATENQSPTAISIVPYGMDFFGDHLLFSNAPFSGVGVNRACTVRALNTSSSTQSIFGASVLGNSVHSIAGDYSLGCLNNASSAFTGGVPGLGVELYDAEGVAVAEDGAGNPVTYLAINDNHCILKLTDAGTLSVAVGSCNSQGNALNGLISAALLRFPKGIEKDPLNPTNLFIVDQTNQATQTIRYANFSSSSVTVFGQAIPSGDIRTLISLTGTPYINDVTAFENQICYSTGNTGNANSGNHNVICKDRTVSAASTETLRCGSPDGSAVRGGGPLSTEQEAQPCSSILLSGPQGLAFDAEGNLYIADRMNHLIRMVKNWF